VVTGIFQENSYILSENNSAVLIDPGSDPEKIQRILKRLNLTPMMILNTHAHLDHIGAVAYLQKIYHIPFYLHPQEKFILDRLQHSALFFGISPPEQPSVDNTVQEGVEISWEEYKIKVYDTPGHTPGGVCYKINGNLFTGDTLFCESIGRTDLPGGDWEELMNSLRKILQIFPDNTRVYPGHGENTTMEHEKKHNPFLLGLLD
jgi:glyoxylase-like metal-dependent hydrolase (beta-lactamase superfamily II)